MNCNRRDAFRFIGLGLAVSAVGCYTRDGGVVDWTQPEGQRMAATPVTLSAVPADEIDPYDQAVGERLKRAREARQLSQDEAGRFIGRSQAAISAYESGANRPTPRQLRDLCRLYGADANRILDVPSPAKEPNQSS